MGFLKWALRLSLIVYAGYLIDSSYFSHLQTPLGRASLVACLLLYAVWFYRHEKSAVAFLVFVVPLAAVFPRVFGSDVPPFHVLFSSAFILAISVKPLIRSARGWFATDPYSSETVSVPDPLLTPSRDRLEFFFTPFAGAWIAVCVISFVFVCLRYANLYPFSGDPSYDYVIARQGHRSSEGILIARWTLASYVNSGVFLIYIVKSGRLSDAIPSTYLKWLFASYSCVGVVAGLQSHFHLDFLNAGGIWQAAQRVNSTFDDPNALACSLILVFPLAILGPLYLSGAGRVLAVLAAGSCLYLLSLAASRTAFAGLVLGLVLIALLLAWRAMRNRRYALLIVLVLMGALVFTGSLIVLEKGSRQVLLVARVGEMWDYLKQNWDHGTILSHIEKVAYSRNFWWPSAIRMFKENPLTGVGIGVFPLETVNQGAPFDTAGSQYLQMLAEYGIWGLLFTIGLAVVVMYRFVVRAWRESRGPLRDYLWLTAIGAAAIAFFVSLNFGSHLVFNQVSFVFALVLGSLVRMPVGSHTPQPGTVPRRWTAALAAVPVLFFVAQLTTLSYSPPLEFRKGLIGQEQDVFGYPPEKWNGGFEFRWLTSLNWKRIQVDRSVLNYGLYTANPEAPLTGVTANFYLDDRLLKTVKLTNHQWATYSIDLPPDTIGKSAVLKVVVDRTWQPAGDLRRLGVALREVETSAARQ